MRLLLWYSGEHAELPKAEARAVFEGAGHRFSVLLDRPRFQVVETDLDEASTQRLVARLGLAHEASAWLWDSEPDPAALERGAQGAALDTARSFAVRAGPIAAPPAMGRMEAERLVGAALAPGRRIDLKRPEQTVRAYVDADRIWVGRRFWDRDPKETAARHVQRRPAFSPVSLPPKLARALINLTRIGPGKTLVDPFCGTGGVLLEAAAMGIGVVGSDIDPEMVEGSRRNLHHFGLSAKDVFVADIGDARRELERRGLHPADAIVTDLPYGRSASTGKEAVARLYQRAFAAIRDCLRPGALAVVGVPSQGAADAIAAFLEPVDLFRVRVHRSLTRHFALLRRGPATLEKPHDSLPQTI